MWEVEEKIMNQPLATPVIMEFIQEEAVLVLAAFLGAEDGSEAVESRLFGSTTTGATPGHGMAWGQQQHGG